MPRLAQLQKENNIQKRQLFQLVGRIEELKEKIVALEESDHEMEKMVNLGTSNGQTYFMGVGGSDPGITSSDYFDANTHLEPVPLIPYSLDDLDYKINSGEVKGPEECQDKEDAIYSKDKPNNGDRR